MTSLMEFDALSRSAAPGSTASRLLARAKICGECWEWQRALSKGYGRLGHGGAMWPAHRLSYTVFVAPVPDGLVVRHACDNKACIRPAHLLVGTTADNSRDAVERGRTARGARNGMNTHPERRTLGTASPQARLTEALVAEARVRVRNGESLVTLAHEYGVAHGNMSRAVTGDRWRHVDEPPVPKKSVAEVAMLGARWVTVDGVTRCVTEWARITGIAMCTLSARLRSGWDHKRAVTEPVHSEFRSVRRTESPNA